MKTASERREKADAKKRDAGLVRIQEWCTPEEKLTVKELLSLGKDARELIQICENEIERLKAEIKSIQGE